MNTPEYALIASIISIVVTSGYILYQINKDKSVSARDLHDRVIVLETKMGLLFRSVEDNLADVLAKSNPINLTQSEQAAAQIYKLRKRDSPTLVLKQLNDAITREIPLGYMSEDQKAVFTLIQATIKAQLFDRHELDDA